MNDTPGSIVGLVRSGRATKKTKRMLVRGLVPLDTVSFLQCLASLTLDGDKDIAIPARQMLGAMLHSDIVDSCSLPEMPADVLDIMARFFSHDEAVLEEILHHPSVARKTVSFIATLPLPGPLEIIALQHPWIDPFPPILERLRGDGATPPEVIMEWQERHELLLQIRSRDALAHLPQEEDFHPSLLEETEAPPQEQKNRPATELVRDMTAGRKVALALKGNSEVRRALITDKNRSVATKVLENPGITESEVVFFARLTSLSRDILRIIGTDREWTKNKTIVRSLVANPKTPLGISMRHLPGLSLRDIKGLTTNRNIPEALRRTAGAVLRHRIENR